MSKLSIVIPAYNEEDHIFKVVQEVFSSEVAILTRSGLNALEVVVVNDGSSDQTPHEIAKLLKQYPSLVAIHHPKNRGYGAALKTGFVKSTGDYLAFMDGDGTIDPYSFVELYQELKSHNVDIAVGRRFGKSGSKMPLIRKLGNYFFAHLLSFLSGVKVKDTASGIRLFKRSLLPLTQKLPDGLHFTPAMSAKLLHENIAFVEVSVDYAERSGESKLKVIHDGLRFLHIILSTVLLYNPFKVFFMVGLFFMGVSLILLAHPMYLKFTLGHLPFTDYIYRSIGALYFFVVGAQIVLFGILARFIVSTFFKRHESSAWIHRLNDRIKMYDRIGWYGGTLLATGILLNFGYLFEYLQGKLNLHWSWLMLAAGFIMIGAQMVITGVIMSILRDIQREMSGPN